MPVDIVVPVLGESITEATIARWLKQPGDSVQVDEPIVELETEKATVELPAPKAGVLAEVLFAEGQDVEVGAVIGRISDEGADAVRRPEPDDEMAAQDSDDDAAAEEPVVPASREAPRAAASRAEAERALGDDLDPTRAGRSGKQGGVTEADLRSFLQLPHDAEPGRSGPAARKLLADHGLDPAAVAATGRGGRITKGDVQAHLEKARQPDAAAPHEERVRMTRLRRTLAARLKQAQNSAAILTTFNEIDMSGVMHLRKRHGEDFEKKHGVRLGFTSFFTKAVVAALREIPVINAEIDGDEIVYKHHYDIGMAVSAPQGLLVPVIRDCDRKSFAEIEAALAELAARARDGKLAPQEMAGGTFSISNGGVFGSLLSTPILNQPQSGILGLHKIEDRPVAAEGQVVIRPMMYVSLSYDHRIVDGREAVTFLVRVKQALEDPQRLLLDL